MKKILSAVLVMIMLITLTAGLDITANAYTSTGSGYNMEIGESVTITDDNMTNGTGYAKTWSSSNSSVASVTQTGQKTARVTAGRIGKATITCTTESWVTVYVYDYASKRNVPRTTYSTTYHYWEINVSEMQTQAPATKPVEQATQATQTTPESGSQSEQATVQQNDTGAVSNQAQISKPKKTSVSKLSSGHKKIKVSWKKVSGVSGYQIQYAQNNKFTKGKKTVTVKKSSTTSKTIKGLKSKKKYYFRVRTYKNINGKKVYSSWSKIKTATAK